MLKISAINTTDDPSNTLKPVSRQLVRLFMARKLRINAQLKPTYKNIQRIPLRIHLKVFIHVHHTFCRSHFFVVTPVPNLVSSSQSKSIHSYIRYRPTLLGHSIG